jgi:CreA protein
LEPSLCWSWSCSACGSSVGPSVGTTGSDNTKFRLLDPDDKIVVDGFDDPKVEGVACHISRAQTGGMKGAFGVAEDTSDASIACRQIGSIKIKEEIKNRESVLDDLTLGQF